MNDLLCNELRKSFGKTVVVFLQNGFRYQGEVLDVDDSVLKLKDFKSGVELIKVEAIQQMRLVTEDQE